MHVGRSEFKVRFKLYCDTLSRIKMKTNHNEHHLSILSIFLLKVTKTWIWGYYSRNKPILTRENMHLRSKLSTPFVSDFANISNIYSVVHTGLIGHLRRNAENFKNRSYSKSSMTLGQDHQFQGFQQACMWYIYMHRGKTLTYIKKYFKETPKTGFWEPHSWQRANHMKTRVVSKENAFNEYMWHN